MAKSFLEDDVTAKQLDPLGLLGFLQPVSQHALPLPCQCQSAFEPLWAAWKKGLRLHVESSQTDQGR